MNSKEWLEQATKQLERSGIGTARLDVLVLLEDVTSKDRAWLLAHPEFKITLPQQTKLKNLLNKRAVHFPLAYIRGKTEFYGREFLLTPAVLEPRPESETMIDLLLKLPKLPTQPKIADVGAGCGAIGITAKLELPKAQIDLLEIDSAALKVARINVDKFTLKAELIKTDLLTDASSKYDVLLCNLPYVPDGFQINPAALNEPRIAIFGGPDGLDIYRLLFKQVKNRPNQPLYILTESMPPQHSELQAIAGATDYQMSQSEDFIQVFELEH